MLVIERFAIFRSLPCVCLWVWGITAAGAAPERSATVEERHLGKREYFSGSDVEREAEAIWDRPYMSGDWQGYRGRLADAGVTVGLSYVADILGNPVGGRSRGMAYASSMGLDILADLETLAGIEGWQLYTTVVWRMGTNLSQRKIGNTFTAAQVFGGQNVRLYALDLRRSFADERYHVKFGRISQGDDFLSSPLNWNYVNNGFDGNPVAVFFNAPMEAYPNATWGAFFKAQPVDQWYGQLGVYGADTDINRNSAHGLDWSFRFNKGAFLMGQTGYRLNQGSGATGLPGTYSIGGYYVTGDFDRFLAVEPVQGTYGGYLMAEQVVYRPVGEAGQAGESDTRGLTAWAALLLAPPDRSKMPLFVSGGLVYQGLFPGRKDDRTAVGFIYGWFSNELRQSQQMAGSPEQTTEAVVEVTHRFQVNPWLYIQPNCQLLINPGGAGLYSDALVIGAQVGVTF